MVHLPPGALRAELQISERGEVPKFRSYVPPRDLGKGRKGGDQTGTLAS